MKEQYWIDGYNLLFYLDETENLEKGRDKLLILLNEMAVRAELSPVVVFDGAQDFRRTHFDALEIVYTPPGVSADDYILEDLEAKTKIDHRFVVTNDKHLGKCAKLLKAQVIKVSEFLNILTKKSQKIKIRKKAVQAPKTVVVNRELERLVKIFEERYQQYEKEGWSD